ncbi:MAG: LPXTG cell wall anchor domain-containing protein [Lachnospiraceae bacterium]|nr:LPXTG cell wall anchor domain-containing protein [Lachnospiraceae bacterium]
MKPKQRFLSLLLCGTMLFSLYPAAVLAEAAAQDSDISIGASGLCEHHTEHDEDCGYTEGAEGTSCNHEHTEGCYTPATERTPCGFVCEECNPQDSGDPTQPEDVVTIESVQTMIDSLPWEDEIAQLDMTRYLGAAAALERLHEKVATLSNAVMLEDYNDLAIVSGTDHLAGGQGSSIYYGNYYQSDANGQTKDPVKWRVLSNADGKLFLLADQNLDRQIYHESDISITWENCTLRKWLNGSYQSPSDSGFYDAAFSNNEQLHITETTNTNANHPTYNTPGGKETQDKVFALSIAEADNGDYFPGGNNSRKGKNTAYAAAKGAYGGAGNNGDWWLRSPGSYADHAVSVYDTGSFNLTGRYVDVKDVAVRPAINLNLNSVLFTSAAEGGKPDGGPQAVKNYSGNEWKLTLHDSSRNSFDADVIAYTGTKAVISYQNAITGGNEYISVLIADDAGAYTHYGRLKNLTDSSDVSGTVEIDLTGIDMTGKTLHVFNEQYNGDKMTDYASELKKVEELQKNAYNINFTLSNGLSTDGQGYCFMSADSYNATLTPDPNHVLLPENLTVTVGGKPLTATTEYTYENGTLTIPAASITDDIEITASGVVKTYSISVTDGSGTFEQRHIGYDAAPDEQTFTIENTGNQKITNLQVSLSGDGFILTPPAKTELVPNDTTTFTVRPNTDLGAGEHKAEVNITGSNVTATVPLSFTVSGHSWDNEWTHNNTHHWHECTVGSCTEKKDEAEHNFNDGNSCTVCPYSTTDAETPNIIGQPQGTSYTVGDTATPLSVTASVNDGGDLSYQWYSNSENNTITGNPISGATSASYTPPTTLAGTTYYYCVVTNTNNSATGATTMAATSNTVEIIVKATPTPTKYNVKVENHGNGMASASLSRAIAGTTITLAATPDAGYRFKEWQVVSGGVVISGNTFTMPTNDVIVKAIFESDGGTTSPTHTHNWNTAAWTQTDTLHWHECTAAGCDITDDSKKNGYGVHVYDNDTDEYCNTCNYKRTVTPPSTQEYAVTVQINGKGTASASPDFAAQGETITLTATPDTGYYFSKWEVVYGDVSISGNSFNMPANNVTVKAIFEEDSVKTKIETAEITEVPDGLKNTEFNTVEKIKNELTRVLMSQAGYTTGNTALYDVRLQISTDSGHTWVDATEANFPAEGITVVLPYPNGTWKNTHDFVVTHMFTVTSPHLGTTAGQTEQPAVYKTDSGIKVTLNGLSPVGIAWKTIDSGTGDNPGSGDGVTSTTYYRLTFETNGGSRIDSIRNASGTKIDLAGYQPTREGYDFSGWYADKALTEKLTSIRLDRNKTVYAGWTKQAAPIDPDKENPSTGDSNNITLWAGILLISSMAIAALLASYRRKNGGTSFLA